MSDKIREAALQHLAKREGWTSTGVERRDDGSFSCGWHESVYEDFKAGVLWGIAQQPAPAALPDALDEYRQFEKWRQNWNGKWPRPADPGEWEAWQARARLAAAPAAPVAAGQEPIGYCSPLHMRMLREGSAFSVPVNPAAFRDRSKDDCAIYAAPLAAEQPSVLARADLPPDEVHQMAFEEGQPADNGDGYLFTAEEFDLFVERLLSRAPHGEQPDTVKVPRELLDRAAYLLETLNEDGTTHGELRALLGKE